MAEGTEEVKGIADHHSALCPEDQETLDTPSSADERMPRPRIEKWQIWLVRGPGDWRKQRPALVFDILDAVSIAFVCPLFSTNRQPMQTAGRVVLLPRSGYGISKPSQVGVDKWQPVPFKYFRHIRGKIDRTDQEVVAGLLRQRGAQEGIARVQKLVNNGLSFEKALEVLLTAGAN